MKRSFSARELLLICIAAVLALGIFYYEVVYKGVANSIKQYDAAQLEDELTSAQIKVSQEANMKKAIESASSSTTKLGTIEVYNNLANEVNALGTILNGNATNTAISWAAPTLTDTTIRRQAVISFGTTDYASAKALVQKISEMQYRNIINSVEITNSTSTTDNITNVSITMTFFETSIGASSTDGVVTMSSSTTTSDISSITK